MGWLGKGVWSEIGQRSRLSVMAARGQNSEEQVSRSEEPKPRSDAVAGARGTHGWYPVPGAGRLGALKASFHALSIASPTTKIYALPLKAWKQDAEIMGGVTLTPLGAGGIARGFGPSAMILGGTQIQISRAPLRSAEDIYWNPSPRNSDSGFRVGKGAEIMVGMSDRRNLKWPLLRA